ncbi:GNAT family N-acetyltransferase [Lentisphaerota bacterium ZTH]|nr:GNAT family N-acetyltransferase [Lentisphaerota bacterium]WET06557.1 GNAT family N-acetyltransferase [Lentisphaerota bacterium ZTH]
MNFVIRKAGSSDLPEIQDIARRTIDACYRSFLGDDGVDWFLNSGASDQYLSSNLCKCQVIEADGKIAGFYICRGCLLDLIMVDCNHQRKGIGSRLLQHCEESLFTKYDEIRLESFEDNKRTINFYRKHKWIEKKRIMDEDANCWKITFIKKR